MNAKKFCLHCLAWWIIIMFNVLAFYIFYLTCWPFQTVDYLTQPSEVLTKKVVAGNEVIFKVHYNRTTTIPTIVSTMLCNDMIYVLTPAEIIAPMGEHVAIDRVRIPFGVESGTYHLERACSWRVNSLRTITKRWISESFEVVK